MTKFLVDRMLGQTAKWLRLLGVDAAYAPKGEDEKLQEIADEEDRVIITRDKELGSEENAILVEKKPPEKIIKKVLDEYDVEIKPLTRCSKCNGVVEKVEKEEVEGEVPENVFELNDEFWCCVGCGQYYWRGSHWEKIMEKIEGILDD
ncbi:MAG: Mut7-C RNAse domain-containing protein [Candidatus Thermoplasmatota archaeon]|nr:Mut7-C RNAse domain-containing protein [Candidatus Thermoplasmatota archaeon]MBS3789635.1 Mut7-C RNAse domain-containing protein [Candidatus Thermoplasmatota archaeon]